MDFHQAEEQYQYYKHLYDTRQLSAREYYDALAQLQVVDDWQRVWRIQERSGTWARFENGQWIPDSPYTGRQPQQTLVYPAMPPPVYPGQPPQASPYPPPYSPPVRPRPYPPMVNLQNQGGQSKSLCGVFSVLGILFICIVGLGVGYYIFQNYDISIGGLQVNESGGSTSTPQKQALQPVSPQITLKQGQVTSVSADGKPVTDKNGVSISLPSGALPGEIKAELKEYQASGGLFNSLASQNKLETPFYSVESAGLNDALGRAEVSFPAPSPDSRVVVVVDQAYVAMLDVVPQNGKLIVHAPAGPADRSGLKQKGSVNPAGSIHYGILTPKKGSYEPSEQGGGKLGSPASQQAGGTKSCMPVMVRSEIISYCRSNAAGTIQALYATSVAITEAEVDRVVLDVENRMNTYLGLGFVSAKLSSWSPMQIVITGGSGDPQYKVMSGTIYIPLDVAKGIGGAAGRSLWHEMGHWIEDEEYNMTWAFWSGNKTWWLEVAAENMVMLVAPDYLVDNMSTYGTITSSDNKLAFQNAPYQWPSDFYVHAQLVKVNMCDSGSCPLSKASFVEAINKGTYPLDDSGAQTKLTANLDDYARYLLGTAPQKANSGILLTAVKTQSGFGQNINVSKSTKGDFALTHDGNAPQIQKGTTSGLENLSISAEMQKDGVYPLQVDSGRDGKYPGLPAMLVVESGAPFYYRLDGGEVKFHDGGKKLTLGPVHLTMGLKNIRLVAFSKTGSQSFKAKVEVIDLKGAWAINTSAASSDGVSCTNIKEGDKNQLYLLFPMIFGMTTAAGDMKPDAAGPSLDWNMVAGRLPADTKTSDFTYKASALIGTEDIRLQGKFSAPKKSAHQPSPDLLSVGLLSLGAVVPLTQWKKKGGGRTALLSLLFCLLLAGCIGLEIYGTDDGEVKFTKIEYIGGDQPVSWDINKPAPDGKPIWSFTKGTAVHQLNVTTVVSVDGSDKSGKKETSQVCTGTVGYNVTGGVYPEIKLIQTKK